MAGEIVPFGKYKGQPVEVMAQDRAYVDWLAGQAWFRDRFAPMYTLIVNNFQEPSETPEHNAMQALFLEDAFCAAFVEAASPGVIGGFIRRQKTRREEAIKEAELDVQRRQRDVDATRPDHSLAEWRAEELAKAKMSLAYVQGPIWDVKWSREFEVAGADVLLHLNRDATPDYWKIEVKPTIGDDYPAVLRQMRASNSRHLLVGVWTGSGVTREQFVAIFASSDIRVVFRDDIPT